MCDAGYSQFDAENQRLARYLTDTASGENTNGCEHEARKTIASVYSQAAHQFIQSPQQIVQHKVGQLVETFRPELQREPPDIEKIVETVEACVPLNFVEWAVERNRLKAICDDGLKIADLARLHKEKMREHQQAQYAALVDIEGYCEVDGRMVYRRHTHRGVNERVIANWIVS